MPSGIYKRVKRWNWKSKMSQGQKDKISKFQKGRIKSEETKNKIRKILIGHPVSKETRNKMNQNNYPQDNADCSCQTQYMKKEVKKSNSAVNLGRKGGKAFVKKYGKKYMAKLARAGAKARWGK